MAFSLVLMVNFLQLPKHFADNNFSYGHYNGLFWKNVMGINQWPKSEQPREKLLQYGASHLSNAELLAIFLRTGIKGKSAIELAQELLHHFGSINHVLEANLKSFTQVKGLGSAKYCQLKATVELVTRHFNGKVEESHSYNNQEVVKNFLLCHFFDFKHEVFACMFLDNKNKLIKIENLFIGTINQAQVYPRVLAQSCLKNNAAAVIFAHNHPSGNLKASQSDIDITKKLITTLKLIDVRVLDHFIIGKNDVMSMAQHGLMSLG